MTLYHIYECPSCEMKAEISVEGSVWCGCGLSMRKIGEMYAKA